MKLFAASLSARPCAHGRACICSRSEGLRATVNGKVNLPKFGRENFLMFGREFFSPHGKENFS